MPTKFWLGATNADYFPLSFGGAWQEFISSGYVNMIDSDIGMMGVGSGGSGSTKFFNSTGSPRSALMYCGVSRKLSPQTISGTFNLVAGVKEGAANHDLSMKVHINVRKKSDDSTLGTLLNNYTETGNEWDSVNYTGKALVSNQTLTSVTIPDDGNDYRLVVEFGCVTYSLVGVLIDSRMKWGIRSSDYVVYPDLTIGQIDTGFKGYFEFSGNITCVIPANPNKTPESAIVISSLPFNATVTPLDIYDKFFYKYTPVEDGVISSLLCSLGAATNSQITMEIKSSISGGPPLVGTTQILDLNSYQRPVKIGETYFFIIYSNDTPLKTLVFSVVQGPTGPVQIGDIFIPVDDQRANLYDPTEKGFHPSIWFIPETGDPRYLSGKFASCELGGSLANGKFALVEKGLPIGSLWIHKSAPELNLVSRVPLPAETRSFGTDFTSFYLATNVSPGTSQFVIYKVSEIGVIDPKTWTLPEVNMGYNVNGFGCMAVSRDGKILYYPEYAVNGAIKRYDLVSDTILPSFPIPPGGNYQPSDTIVLRDGTIAAIFHRGNPYNDLVLHYAPDGTILHTLNYGNSQVHHICHSFDDNPTKIWVWISIGTADGSKRNRNQFKLVGLADGVATIDWTRHAFSDGEGPYDFTTNCSPEMFGAEDSCPLIIMMDDSYFKTSRTGIYEIPPGGDGDGEWGGGGPGSGGGAGAGTPGGGPGAGGPIPIPSHRFDNYYGTEPAEYEKNIPNPTVKTAYIGD